MVDLSQSPSPNKVLGFFHTNSEKGNLTNGEHHGKTDLAMVEQEYPDTPAQHKHRQCGSNGPQASANATQPGRGLFAEIPALIHSYAIR